MLAAALVNWGYAISDRCLRKHYRGGSTARRDNGRSRRNRCDNLRLHINTDQAIPQTQTKPSVNSSVRTNGIANR